MITQGASLTYRHCTSLEQMLPNLGLLQVMYPDLTAETYQAMLPDMISKSYVQIVASMAGQDVGVVAYWLIPRLWTGLTLDLDNFVVMPEYRSQGIGEQILAYIEGIAKQNGCVKVVLDAYTNNFKAQKFYLTHNYRQLGFHLVKDVNP